MQQYNPPHPGEFIKRVCIEANNLDANVVAQELQINIDEFNRLISGSTDVLSVLASKLFNVLGRTPESWLAIQRNFDLWNLKKSIELKSR